MALGSLKLGMVKKLLFCLIITITIVASLYLAFILRFEGAIPETYSKRFLIFALVFVMIKITILFFFRLDRISLRYVSLPEIISVGKANLLSFFVLVTVISIFRDLPLFAGFPRSLLIIDLLISFFVTSGIYLFCRIYLQITKKSILRGERTLIVGAGDAGEQLLRNISETEKCGYLPIGFIDDNPHKRNLVIHGIKVLGTGKEIPKLVKNLNVSVIIIAMPSASTAIIRKVIKYAQQAAITKIKILPPLTEIIGGKVGINDIKNIDPEDLLGRQVIKIDTNTIGSQLTDKVILVTGAAGSIGSEVCRQALKYPIKGLLILDQDETGIFNLKNELGGKYPSAKIISIVANIRDRDKIYRIFERFLPQLVFHAAAYKHVPLMEAYPEEAIKTNIFGTYNIAEASFNFGVEKFVLISTDKAVSPTSVMGATKRMAETIVSEFNRKGKTRFLAVRFGNIVDSRGNMFQIFKQEIQEKREVTVTHPDMKRYLMTVSEAVLLVLQASTFEKGDLFALDMGELVKVVDFAKELIRSYGYEPDKDIPIVFTGIRPGEKLEEEYFSDKEKIVETKFNKIYVIEPDSTVTLGLDAGYISRLEELMKGGAIDKLIDNLKETIPDYHPKY